MAKVKAGALLATSKKIDTKAPPKVTAAVPATDTKREPTAGELLDHPSMGPFKAPEGWASDALSVSPGLALVASAPSPVKGGKVSRQLTGEEPPIQVWRTKADLYARNPHCVPQGHMGACVEVTFDEGGEAMFHPVSVVAAPSGKDQLQVRRQGVARATNRDRSYLFASRELAERAVDEAIKMTATPITLAAGLAEFGSGLDWRDHTGRIVAAYAAGKPAYDEMGYVLGFLSQDSELLATTITEEQAADGAGTVGEPVRSRNAGNVLVWYPWVAAFGGGADSSGFDPGVPESGLWNPLLVTDALTAEIGANFLRAQKGVKEPTIPGRTKRKKGGTDYGACYPRVDAPPMEVQTTVLHIGDSIITTTVPAPAKPKAPTGLPPKPQSKSEVFAKLDKLTAAVPTAAKAPPVPTAKPQKGPAAVIGKDEPTALTSTAKVYDWVDTNYGRATARSLQNAPSLDILKKLTTALRPQVSPGAWTAIVAVFGKGLKE